MPPSEKEVASARARANRLYRSPAYRAAYVRGAVAALGDPPLHRTANPYRLDQTWRAGYHRAWASGHMSVAPEDLGEE